ncbi:YciI family protein [Mycobacterium sp. NPDC003449]
MKKSPAMNVFVAISRYLVPIADVELALPEHARWVAKGYAAGKILVSGRQSPANGGVTVFVERSRQHAEALVAEDPFSRKGIAEYTIVEFTPSEGDRQSAEFSLFLNRQPESL